MRLKRIDIKGFKSFAKETTLHFNENVVGVVGPNGSGKSNIVDAIRWVLGEQKSKELRLDRMTDVLFNGTKKRKAGGLAQVTITFDNDQKMVRSEFLTIGISRLLYRDGTSEYRINNVPCRLKDIHSLLQDTGIGSNSYAIIALGMVDDILQDKEHSRRRMFEQAAGIAKYKKRKHETLLKLKSTEGDLDRVEDLLFEIEGNLKTLEKQAKRTKRYFGLKETYKEEVIQLTKERSKHLQYEYELTKKQITENQDKLRESEIAATNLEADLARIKKDNIDQEENVSTLQKDLNELVNAIRKIESEKSLNQQKINFKNQNVQRIQDYIGSQKNRLIILQKEIEEKTALIASETRIKQENQSVLDNMSGSKEEVFAQYGSAKSDLEELTSTFQNQEKRIFELEKQLAISQNQKNFHAHQIDKLSADHKSRVLEIDMFSTQLEGLEKEGAELNSHLKKLRLEEEQRLELLQESTQRKESLTKDLADVLRQLDSKQNEHDLLKSLVENFEGFPESIQFLNKTQKWERKAPLLTDLIYCSEKYRIVLEQYLENFLNYFVVDNTTDAIKAIELLAGSQKGKANFFILDAIRPSALIERNLPEAISIKEVVEVDRKYRPLTDMLFHNVFLIEGDIEDYLNNEDYADCTLLSADGKLVAQKGNRISGGSIGLFEGKKIGRKKNLDKITKEISVLIKQQSKLEDAIAKKHAEIKGLEEKKDQAKINSLTETLQNTQTQKVQVETRLNQAKQQLDNLLSQLGESDESVIKIKTEQEQLENELAQEKEAYQEASEKVKKQGEEYEQLLTVYNDENQKFNEARIELVKHENTIQNLENDLIFSRKQIEDISLELENQSQNLLDDNTEITSVSEIVKQQENDLLGMYDSKKGLEQNLSSVEESYFKIRGAIHEIDENLKAKQKASQQLNYLINELKDKFADSKYQLQAIYERVKIEFGIDQEDVLKTETAEIEISLDEFQEKVDRLKIRIENFGEINPMALEAYEEMNDRYQNIIQQRNDIVEAKESLIETIKEIENTATQKFLDAFDNVREYFKQVFRSLFSDDDDCDLVLINAENPLDSDIEIIAKPKGKRPVTLNQLSGGEKTLTATALLFAMYLLKPAPFCIFDEVDAPLDDANVEKFNRIIKKFSDSSQFIIVTHNKLTMAAVDVIYGVYMEEQGVSNVSEVDFRSFDHLSLLEVQN